MAWTSFIPTATMRDALNNTIALDIGSVSSPDALKVALYDTSYAQTIDTDPLTYATTNEVTGTNWAAGGVALAGNALTLSAGAGLKFDATDVSVVSTTISSGAFGCLIYDNTITPHAGIVAVWFGGTGYTTNNGTFGITWDAAGIYTVTLH
ncbi:MAG: hypothetical protein ACREHG_06985 [Candidatus Saccharimonadales bacterium]